MTSYTYASFIKLISRFCRYINNCYSIKPYIEEFIWCIICSIRFISKFTSQHMPIWEAYLTPENQFTAPVRLNIINIIYPLLIIEIAYDKQSTAFPTIVWNHLHKRFVFLNLISNLINPLAVTLLSIRINMFSFITNTCNPIYLLSSFFIKINIPFLLFSNQYNYLL